MTSVNDTGPFTARCAGRLAEPDAVDDFAERTIVAIPVPAVSDARAAGRTACVVRSVHVGRRPRALKGERVGLPPAGGTV